MKKPRSKRKRKRIAEQNKLLAKIKKQKEIKELNKQIEQ